MRKETIGLQRKQTAFQFQQSRIMELPAHNQNRNKLPQPRVPVFDGNPFEYRTFVRAFENLVESRTFGSTDRLYYLEQFTAGDIKEIVRSCHHLPAEEGYDEARRLLRRKYGDDYRIAPAYEMKVLDWPSLKAEDGVALNPFSVFLASCKNALAGSQYMSKFDQPGNIQSLVLRIPYSMRERWRHLADDIMDRQLRPVQFSDFVALVNREARILTNPVFGKISDTVTSAPGQRSSGCKTSNPKNLSLLAHVGDSEGPTSETVPQGVKEPSQRADGEQGPQTPKVQPSGIDQGPSQEKNRCLYCSRNHALEDCQSLRWKLYQERIQFLLSKKLCFGCLSTDHGAKFCPQRKQCKIANCKGRHPTVLHTSPCERPAVDVGVGTEDIISTQVCSHIVKTGTSANSETAREGRRTGMAVIPVRVRVKDSDKSVITYAFLDNGSNSSFSTELLMKQLGINAQQVKISLSTLEKKNSITNSFLVRDLLVSDLDEIKWNSLLTLYTRPEIPVSG